MKKTDIVAGKTYHNGKIGRFYGERQVLELGPQFKLYDSQTETDCLRYVPVKGPDSSRRPFKNSTRTSFAAWAQGVVGDPSHD